jgi:type II secretory pathway component GspD/PulD (secretin)
MRCSVIVLAVCTMLGARVVPAQAPPDAHAGSESRAAGDSRATPELRARPAEFGPNGPATPASVAVNGGIPIGQVIAAVARKSGKKFLVDPRVAGDVVLFGQAAGDVTYNQLLTILNVYGFAAVEASGYVEVVPNAVVRQEPLPIVTGKESLPDDAYVTATMHVKSASAAQLVPILRPLLPQQAHLAAYTCGNTLMIVDRFANYKRIEALVRTLDVGEPRSTPEGCDRPPPSQRDGAAPK